MTEPARLWVVDDDRSIRFVLSAALTEAGYFVTAFASADEALAALDAGPPPALVLADVRMPGTDGLALLDRLKTKSPKLPVIVMSAHTDIASTASAFRGGAQEFLSKPFDLDAAVELVGRCLPTTAALPEVQDTPAIAPAQSTELIGQAPAMRALFRAIGRFAQVPLSVLITGETGTGKELVARALHRESPRAGMPFVALNTAAIPAELLESELFGHEAGAFTGAQRRHLGRFEQANGGSLFLDEIGDMPAALQTRLLRVLAEGEFFRVGGRELIRVDVRVIAATHQPLEALVEQGRFRADLLHRLDVVRLHLPPLRDRREDIALLAARFLAHAATRLQLPARRLSPAALERLQAHVWPGNVRELENLCWRLAALAPGETIGVRDLDLARAEPSPGRVDGSSGWTAALSDWTRQQLIAGTPELHAWAREQLDLAMLDAALALHEGRRGEAAAALGMSRNTVTRKLGSSRSRRKGKPA
ncbi:nitrogen regulation protein NR(I) [Thermomonas sp.]|uniref:nitrogen regulation protein NR(I) n=1 Tax=Thermomonas sp. TaxID=1971895 RepID=UPI0026399C19|nr:nitrogen regulation protein NR(I) [Thermomonas sp.]